MNVETQAEKSIADAGGPMTDHAYDGIQEYDNPTPGWWWAIFIGSVVFSAAYLLVYNVDPTAPTVHSALKDDQAYFNKKLFATVGDLQPDDQTILSFIKDPVRRSTFRPVADAIFKGNCASCHGASGEGAVGVNLTDNNYKNVKTLADIHKVITNGAANGAMPAWGQRFNKNEIVLLSAYVAEMRGTNVAGRLPEGEVPPPWPEFTGSTTPAAPSKK